MRDSYCPLITSAYLGTPTVVYANDSEARYTVTWRVIGGPVNIEAGIIEAMINQTVSAVSQLLRSRRSGP